MGTDMANADHTVRIGTYWYAPDPDASVGSLVYHPAALIDCRINFRSLKAGLNHSDENSYTAWLPDDPLPVDWDTPAISNVEAGRLSEVAVDGIAYSSPERTIAPERFSVIETDLLDSLVRRERLTLMENALFGLFSSYGESREDFLARAAEVALQRIEPELKQLKHVFEMQLEQVRESQINKQGSVQWDNFGGNASAYKAEVERLLLKRTEFSETENRVTSLFTGLAGFVLKPLPIPRHDGDRPDSTLELREDLAHVEREATETLSELYTQYLDMVRAVDSFEIRIQPTNIRVLRRALLWVPKQR